MRFLSLYFAIISPLRLYFNALACMLVYKCMLWLHSYFSFWKHNKRIKSAGLFPCIIVIWLGQAYRYIFSYLSLFLIFFSYSDVSPCLMQLHKAAKLLDSGAVRATRFLWRYPTARLILLFYLVKQLNMCLKSLNYADILCGVNQITK